MTRLRLYFILIGLGLLWGLSIPLGKIVLSAGHSPLGYLAWQTILIFGLMTAMIWARGRRTPVAGARMFPVARRYWALFVVVALSGTVIANWAAFRAVSELPAGFMAIVIALVPMAAFPMAFGFGLERWSWLRLGGVVLGAMAVVMLVAPGAGLPGRSAIWFVALGVVAPVCYAVEGTYLALRGTRGLDPVRVLWGASVCAMALSVPLAVVSGGWIHPVAGWGTAHWAILLAAGCHSVAYVGYVWLVGQAGSVFASQTAYVVTGAGVLWSMLLLGERYHGLVWLALVVMLAGMTLVQPRASADPAPVDPTPGGRAADDPSTT